MFYNMHKEQISRVDSLSICYAYIRRDYSNRSQRPVISNVFNLVNKLIYKKV